MKSVCYNQQSRFGQVLFSVENGAILRIIDAGNTSVKHTTALIDLEPSFVRYKKRFPRYTVKMFVVATCFALVVYYTMNWLKFVDALVDSPVSKVYGTFFGGLIVPLIIWKRIAGLMVTELVIFKDRSGTQVFEIIKGDPRNEAFESFVTQVSKLISSAREASDRIEAKGPNQSSKPTLTAGLI